MSPNEERQEFKGISLRKLLSIFCCPPFPSSIGNKLAFISQPSSYELLKRSQCDYFIVLNQRSGWELSANDIKKINMSLIDSESGNKIACAFFYLFKDPRFTLLYSHGNAVDIGNVTGYLLELGKTLGINVLVFDYSGYGMSTGEPTEVNVKKDIESVFKFMVGRYNISPSKIILYGQSIGSVPTIDLAVKQEVAGVIVHSGLASGFRVFAPQVKINLWCDVFKNSSKISFVTSPTLIIHGTEDRIVHISHGQTLYENSANPVKPLFISGAGHNDIEFFPAYFERLSSFLNTDLKHLY